jgi:hypothetical protein
MTHIASAAYGHPIARVLPPAPAGALRIFRVESGLVEVSTGRGQMRSRLAQVSQQRGGSSDRLAPPEPHRGHEADRHDERHVERGDKVLRMADGFDDRGHATGEEEAQSDGDDGRKNSDASNDRVRVEGVADRRGDPEVRPSRALSPSHDRAEFRRIAQ